AGFAGLGRRAAEAYAGAARHGLARSATACRAGGSTVSRGRLGDVIVVGGGVVGAATALALARDGFAVQLVEARQPRPWQAEAELDLRVFALAPSSARLLDQLGVWAAIRDARACAYRGMEVRD